ncbi:MAG: hypothetical protein JWQ74_3322 [Marmoricola sp.]|nr:hypothetical protein [Marmoricola sp.]
MTADATATPQEPLPPGPTAASGRSRPRLVAGVVAAVLAALCLGLLGAKAFASGALPDSWTAADRATDRDAAITAAARRTALVFVTFNHETIDADLKKLSAEATAGFAEELKTYTVQRAALVRTLKSVSTGSVVKVGIGAVSNRTATVDVAATAKEVDTVPAKGKRKESKQNITLAYQLQMTLNKVGNAWRVAKLDVAVVG